VRVRSEGFDNGAVTASSKPNIAMNLTAQVLEIERIKQSNANSPAMFRSVKRPFIRSRLSDVKPQKR
jgi:hypothetical protein